MIPNTLGRKANRPILLLATLLLLGGCVYRIDIQQGNFLEPGDIDQIEPGMTRSQVRYLLGTPMVDDTFNDDRWDYVYYFKRGRSRDVVQRHFVVFFEGDQVARVERPIDETSS